MDVLLNTNFDVTKKTLETKRLLLRPWHMNDAKDLYEYASLPGVIEMAGGAIHEDLRQSKSVLFNYMVTANVYAIHLKSNGKVIGSISLEELYINHLGSEFKNLKGREFSYVLNKDYWGQGLMPEAVNKVID